MLETGLCSAHLPESHKAHRINCYEPLVPQQAPNQNSPLFLAAEGKKIVTSKIAKIGASLVAQLVKNPPAMQETLAQFLGQKDPLGKG